MEQLYLMPGEERYTKFRDENGVPKIRYTYCSLHFADPAIRAAYLGAQNPLHLLLPARQAVQLRVSLNR